MENPVLVEELRGQHVENMRRGGAVVVDAKGHIIKSWGDVNRPVFSRSAVKFLQALPLIESGAAEKWSVTDQELALACASHDGEAIHTKVAEVWLKKLGLKEADLECGIHRPMSRRVAKDLMKKGQEPSVFHNACSGKHLGFLTTALYHNEHIKGYVNADHPVQRRVSHALGEMAQVDLKSLPVGTDGCGIPTHALPLKNLAIAMARFADATTFSPKRQKAIAQLTQAIQQHADLIRGEGGFDTRVIQATKGDVLSKMGAGGMQLAAVLSKGWGVALKMDDGNIPAAELAMASLLESLDVVPEGALETRKPILSHSKHTVGFIRATRAFKTLTP